MSIQEFQQLVKKLVENYPSHPHYIVPWIIVWFLYGNVICRIPMNDNTYNAYLEVEKIMRLYEGCIENLKEKLYTLATIDQSDIFDYIQFISDYLESFPDDKVTISEIKPEDKDYIQSIYDGFGRFDFDELDSEQEFDFLLPYLKPLLDCTTT